MEKRKNRRWKLHFNQIKQIKSLFLILATIILFNQGCSSQVGKLKIIDDSKNIYIVDINAKTSTKENPVTVELNAGTYNVTVIGKSEGGAYEGWTFWRLKKKWINDYSYSSSEFSEVTYADHKKYESSTLALANAKDSKFILKNKAKVNFYINDSPHYDNRGGISLHIAPTNENE